MPNVDNTYEEVVELDHEQTLDERLYDAYVDGNNTVDIDGIEYRYMVCCDEWEEADDDQLYIDGEWYCDTQCAHTSGFYQCERCGDWVHEDWDDTVYIEGDYYCDYECAESDGWRQCSCCGEWRCEDTVRWVHDDCYCDYCSRNACYCEECDEYVWDDEWNHEYDCCQFCAEHIHGAERPNRTRGNELHNYSYRETPVFYGNSDGNSHPFMGVELETDSGNDRAAYVTALSGLPLYHRFWLTEDGSLSNGVEIASHPMTLDEHISSGMWNDIRKTAVKHKFVSHNSGNCGMHVHINRDFFGKSEKAQHVGGLKMMRLMQRFKPQVMTFTRRTSDRWCRFETSRDYSPKNKAYNELYSLFGKALDMSYERDHSQAVNFQHSATFELRVFRGTLKLETLYASLAFAEGLAKYCKSHGEVTIENCTWYDLIEWILVDCSNTTARACLRNYLEAKGLGLTEQSLGDALVSRYFEASNAQNVEVM